MQITGTIKGHDNAGKEWTGDLDLYVDTANAISGTIRWTGKNYDGTETVNGTLNGDTLKFKGVGEVKNQGRYKVVNASYSGTLVEKDHILLHWKGPKRILDGEASGNVTIQK